MSAAQYRQLFVTQVWATLVWNVVALVWIVIADEGVFTYVMAALAVVALFSQLRLVALDRKRLR